MVGDLGEPALIQVHHDLVVTGGCGLLVLVFAGLDGDDVGAHGPDAQRGGDASDDVTVVVVTVQQQDFHQRPGSAAVAVGLAGRGQNASCALVNLPAALAWTSAVAPRSAPGLRTRTSR